MPELTHLDPEGLPRMVDVGDKTPTARRAVAAGYLQLDEAAAEALAQGGGPKGDPWAVVRIAAVQGAKKTSDLIPLAHPLPLDAVTVAHHFDAATRRAWLKVETRVVSRTGVEMEALCGVSVGLLALYDMLKAASHQMELGPVRLLLKEGGRRGTVSEAWDQAPWAGQL